MWIHKKVAGRIRPGREQPPYGISCRRLLSQGKRPPRAGQSVRGVSVLRGGSEGPVVSEFGISGKAGEGDDVTNVGHIGDKLDHAFQPQSET